MRIGRVCQDLYRAMPVMRRSGHRLHAVHDRAAQDHLRDAPRVLDIVERIGVEASPGNIFLRRGLTPRVR
jgi:hypothetical protein